MATSISTVKDRERLKARHDPYYAKVERGIYLGYRKMTTDSVGSWLARSRCDETGQQRKKALGDFAHLLPAERFDAATKAAREWFTYLGQGGSTEVATVKTACETYVHHVRSGRGDKPADDLAMRFKRWLHVTAGFAGTDLQKLTRSKVEAWRKALAATPAAISRDKRAEPLTRPRAASSVNRDMAAVRAALNFAHDSRHVTTDMAWRVALRPIKNADGRRDVYLDRTQRRAMIDKAPADLAALCLCLSLVPLRPGAVAALTAGNFDKRLSTLLIGKDKAGADRRIKLPAATAALFAGLAKDKLPAAPLVARADGKPWTKDAWKKPVKEAAKAAALMPNATIYTLRHSVITDLVTGGLDLLTIAQLSGTSVAMIEKHYGHLRADHAALALATLAI